MTAGDFAALLGAARDPWRFLTLHVSTQDPARGTIGYPCYPYLRKLHAELHAHLYQFRR